MSVYEFLSIFVVFHSNANNLQLDGERTTFLIRFFSSIVFVFVFFFFSSLFNSRYFSSFRLTDIRNEFFVPKLYAER